MQRQIIFRKVRRAKDKDDYETWELSNVSNTINCFDIGDVRSTTVILCNINILSGNNKDETKD